MMSFFGWTVPLNNTTSPVPVVSVKLCKSFLSCLLHDRLYIRAWFFLPGESWQEEVEARGDGGGQQPLGEPRRRAPAERAAPGSLSHTGLRRTDAGAAWAGAHAATERSDGRHAQNKWEHSVSRRHTAGHQWNTLHWRLQQRHWDSAFLAL